MRNYFLVMAILLLSATTISSCKKEKIQEKKPLNTERSIFKAASSSNRIFHGVKKGCSGSGGNCLPDVVITPDDYVIAITIHHPGPNGNGTKNSNVHPINHPDYDNLIAYVVENQDNEMFRLLHKDLIDEIRNKTAYLLVEGFNEELTNQHAYILIKDTKTDNLLAAIPFQVVSE